MSGHGWVRYALLFPVLAGGWGSSEAAHVKSTVTSLVDHQDGDLLGLSGLETLVVTLVYDTGAVDQNPLPGAGEYPDAVVSYEWQVGAHVIRFDPEDLRVRVSSASGSLVVTIEPVDNVSPVDAEFVSGPLTGTVTSTQPGEFGFDYALQYADSEPLTDDSLPAPLPPLDGFSDSLSLTVFLDVPGGTVHFFGQFQANVQSEIVVPVPMLSPRSTAALIVLLTLAGVWQVIAAARQT